MSAYYQHKARVLFPRRTLPAQPQKRDFTANNDYLKALSKWADEEAEARQHNSDIMAKRAHYLKEKMQAKVQASKKVHFGKTQHPSDQDMTVNHLGHPKKWKMLTPDGNVSNSTFPNTSTMFVFSFHSWS
jgi:hypothetical protein